MASCLLVIVILCVLITTVTIIVSFTTPNWIHYPNFSGLGMAIKESSSVCTCNTFFSRCDCGLWLYCTETGDFGENCRWFLSNEFEIEKNLPVWFKAVQALIALAAFTSLIVLILGLSSLCCTGKSCNLHRTASGLMNFCFLLLLSAICTFGAACHINEEVKVMGGGITDKTFGWSFWIAVGATGMSLLSSLLYCGVSCSGSERSI